MKHVRYDGKKILSVKDTTDYGRIKGKSVVVTGGANGLGEVFVRKFVEAGAFVTIGDISEEKATKLATELGSSVQAVKCDVTRWDDQVALMKAAIAKSPTHSVDIVLANAGIGSADNLMDVEDTDEPTKPETSTLDVNIIGVMYTMKAAIHYFHKQPETPDRDRCLILTDSLAGYVDQPIAAQYNASKWAVRSLLHTFRRSCWKRGVRVNTISPSYVETDIVGGKVSQALKAAGVEFALAEDVGRAAMHLAADPEVNGRSLAILPRSQFENGYFDCQHDDAAEDDWVHSFEESLMQIFVPDDQEPSMTTSSLQ